MKSLSFIIAFARKYTWPLVLTIISMLLLVGVQLVIPWIIKTLVAAVTDTSLSTASFSFIDTLAVVALAIFIGRAVLSFLRSYMAHIAGWGVVADLRKHVFDHVQRLSLRFYEDKQTGQMMSRVVNDTDLFEQLIAHAVPDVVVNVLTFVGVGVVLLSLNWKLTLLSMLPIPLVLLSLRLYARRVRPAFV